MFVVRVFLYTNRRDAGRDQSRHCHEEETPGASYDMDATCYDAGAPEAACYDAGAPEAACYMDLWEAGTLGVIEGDGYLDAYFEDKAAAARFGEPRKTPTVDSLRA